MLRAVEFDASGVEVDTRTYADLDKAIESKDRAQADLFREATLERWEFGKRLLAEREANGGKQLPHGRLNELGEELGREKRELQRRMSLAEWLTSEDEVRHACRTFNSWREIVKSFPPKRQPKPVPKKPDVTSSGNAAAAQIPAHKVETSPCLDKDEQLQAEKPWRYAVGEPDEIQQANGDTSFQSFKAYADVYCLGLKGEPKKRMQAYLQSLLKEMENGND